MKDSHTKTLLLKGNTKDGMYVFPPHPSPQAYTNLRASPSQWHARFDHSSMTLVKCIISQASLLVTLASDQSFCSSCCQAKLHSLPYHHRLSTSTAPHQLIFTDVWGLAPLLSRGGFCYYLSFVDHYNRYLWLFPLKCKSDVTTTCLSFKVFVET